MSGREVVCARWVSLKVPLAAAVPVELSIDAVAIAALDAAALTATAAGVVAGAVPAPPLRLLAAAGVAAVAAALVWDRPADCGWDVGAAAHTRSFVRLQATASRCPGPHGTEQAVHEKRSAAASAAHVPSVQATHAAAAAAPGREEDAEAAAALAEAQSSRRSPGPQTMPLLSHPAEEVPLTVAFSSAPYALVVVRG